MKDEDFITGLFKCYGPGAVPGWDVKEYALPDPTRFVIKYHYHDPESRKDHYLTDCTTIDNDELPVDLGEICRNQWRSKLRRYYENPDA